MLKIILSLKLLFIFAFCNIYADSLSIQGGRQKSSCVIIDRGKSPYFIVVPDKSPQAVLKLLTQEIKRFSTIINSGFNVSLPICSEKDLPSGALAIYVGNTEFARNNGVDFSKLSDWDIIIKVVGKKLIIAGVDRSVTLKPGKTHSSYVLSSCRAMTEFLKRFAGVRFLFPGEIGTHIPRREQLCVPSDLNLFIPPPFQYCRTASHPIFFQTANGLFPSASTFLYGGHSYYTALPAAKYGKSHPEYFRLHGKSRVVHGNHLCISNQQVQELLYKEMLRKLDAGYDMVELGQSDAYIPCECISCKKLFNTDDHGEKLWILHRNLAQRLYQERPKKKVMIISYHYTSNPPKSFTEFPPNTAIELCSYSPKTFEKWKKITVPMGFSVYLYNFGAYHPNGLTPTRTYEYLAKQMKLLKDNNIRSIFLCGQFCFPGLEAPAYYVFSRLMEGVSYDTAANDFYQAAFQEAQLPMRTFFTLLDSALKFNPNNSGTASGNTINLIPYIFNFATLSTLERELSTAERMAKDFKIKKRLELIRSDFDFVKTTSRSLMFYHVYRLNPSWDNFAQLEQEVQKRQHLIDKAFGAKPNATPKPFPKWPEIKRFRNHIRSTVQQNGLLYGIIGAPFTWNFKLLREKKLLPCKDIMHLKIVRTPQKPVGFEFDSGVWAAAKWNNMDGIQLATPSVSTKFKLLYDEKNLYIAFEGERKSEREYRSMGNDGPCWGQDCLEILLDPFGMREKHYHFIFNAMSNSYYDSRTGFAVNPLDPNVHKPDPTWNGQWNYQNQLDAKCWRAIVTIPFSNFPVPPPTKGTFWTGNFGREEFRSGIKNPELLLWSPNPEARIFADRDKFGELLFD